MPFTRAISTVIAALAISVSGAAATAPADDFITTGADAPAAHLDSGVYTAGDGAMLGKTQYFWGRRRYCWYDRGRQGPGYYYCGNPWRRRYGWGCHQDGDHHDRAPPQIENGGRPSETTAARLRALQGPIPW